MPAHTQPFRTRLSTRSLTASVLLALIGLLPAVAQDSDATSLPTLMSAEWAAQTCAAWNENSTLTSGLATWSENDADRGYKILRLYRTDCPDSPWMELEISGDDGEAHCSYGGASRDKEINGDADYVMHATTERWLQMGAGNYGPMKAMMFSRLKFKGPMWEAMKNMGPFGAFLQLVAAVDAYTESCPVAAAEPEELLADEEIVPNAKRPEPDILAGGQPTAEALAAAQSAGFKTVVNIRGEGEPGTGREEVEALGMTYVTLPIAGAGDLDAENARAFAELLANAERPVIVHCGSGNRVGGLFALKAHYVDGYEAQEALDIGLAAGLTSLEAAVRSELGLTVDE